jgi:hypothetical protein
MRRGLSSGSTARPGPVATGADFFSRDLRIFGNVGFLDDDSLLAAKGFIELRPVPDLANRHSLALGAIRAAVAFAASMVGKTMLTNAFWPPVRLSGTMIAQPSRQLQPS